MRREGKGEREVQVRQAVNDWLVFGSLRPHGGVSCKATGGNLSKRRRLGLKLQTPPLPSTCWHLKMKLHCAGWLNTRTSSGHFPTILFPTPLEIIHGKLPVSSVFGGFVFFGFAFVTSPGWLGWGAICSPVASSLLGPLFLSCAPAAVSSEGRSYPGNCDRAQG